MSARQDLVQDDDRLAVSVDEAARLLGISRDLAYDLIRRGELPSVRLGRRIVVPRVQLALVLDHGGVDEPVRSYNQNLWIDHPSEGAAYLPR